MLGLMLLLHACENYRIHAEYDRQILLDATKNRADTRTQPSSWVIHATVTLMRFKPRFSAVLPNIFVDGNRLRNDQYRVGCTGR